MQLRDLPSVDELAREMGDPLAVAAARSVLERAREEIRAGADPGDLRARIRAELETSRAPRLRRVLNATGVIVHTNLGRAPLARRRSSVGRGRPRLLEPRVRPRGGRRAGSRQDHVAAILRRLTGAEAALVVNNNAAAVLLALAALAEGREVLVSRGELIEIGDGFRIPDVLARSGRAPRRGRHHEPDARRRLRAGDRPGDGAAPARAPVELPRRRLHRSSPRSPSSPQVARRHGLPLVDDLGSGVLVELPDEPSAREPRGRRRPRLLLGRQAARRPAGRGSSSAAPTSSSSCGAIPLQRALRADKLTLAALEGTLALYLDPGSARAEIPVLRMLDEPADAVRARAERLAGARRRHGRGDGRARRRRRAAARRAAELRLRGRGEELAAPLRLGEPPVVGVVRDGRLPARLPHAGRRRGGRGRRSRHRSTRVSELSQEARCR